MWDTIIVGAGLAGATLAWRLQSAGQRVLLLDADAAVTASKIAAGLVTPITGLRLTVAPDFSACLAEAQAFYAGVEAATGVRVFHARTAVRLFQTDSERQYFAARRSDAAFEAQLCAPQPEPLVDAAVVAAEGGGFAMVGAQLDVGAFLAATRAHVAVDTMEVDWVRDVSFEAAGVRLGTHRARRVVSCEGYGAVQNPYLRHLRFNAARGDILTLHVRGLALRQVLHRGIWLAPTMDPEIFNAGATYDLNMLDAVPSAAGRVEIERKLKALLRVPFTVVAHQGAVRPILLPNGPVFGLHPTQPRLGFFNGLGSKGSLLAPASARQFAAMLPGDA